MVSTPLRVITLFLEIVLHIQLYITLVQDHIDHKCSIPQEREGFSETDSTQYCNSRNTQDRGRSSTSSSPTNA